MLYEPQTVKGLRMTDSMIFGKTWELLGKSLNVSARRHNLVSGNIANVDTIGYKPRDLDFQETLEKAMAGPAAGEMTTSHPDHFGGEDVFDISMAGETRDDANGYHLDSVDIDREMTTLIENNIKYRTSTEMLLRKMGMLRHAITEGGK